MTERPGWTPWPPHSAPPPPSRPPPPTNDGHHHLNGNVYVMLGELVGNVRWLVMDSTRKTGQIDDIQAKLRAGSTMFQHHDFRIKNLEAAKVSRFERLTKRWAAYLIPVVTALLVTWATGDGDLAARVVGALPK